MYDEKHMIENEVLREMVLDLLTEYVHFEIMNKETADSDEEIKQMKKQLNMCQRKILYDDYERKEVDKLIVATKALLARKKLDM